MKFPTMQITRALTLIACLMTPCVANAQKQEVSIRFVSFPIMDDPKPVEVLIGEGKTIEVELPTNSLSPAYKVPKLQNWVLGDTVTGKDGKPSFKVYGQINAGSTMNQLVMVLRKGIADEDGYDLVCFDGDAGGFSGGKYIILNGSSVDLAGELGDLKFALKPKKHVLLAPKPSAGENDQKLLYATLYYRKGERAKAFYTNVWSFSEGVRTLVVIYHDPYNQRLRTHTIFNYVQ